MTFISCIYCEKAAEVVYEGNSLCRKCFSETMGQLPGWSVE